MVRNNSYAGPRLPLNMNSEYELKPDVQHNFRRKLTLATMFLFDWIHAFSFLQGISVARSRNSKLYISLCNILRQNTNPAKIMFVS